jgi:hypothetical protein
VPCFGSIPSGQIAVTADPKEPNMSNSYKDIFAAAIVLALVAFPMAKLINLTTEIIRAL